MNTSQSNSALTTAHGIHFYIVFDVQDPPKALKTPGDRPPGSSSLAGIRSIAVRPTSQFPNDPLPHNLCTIKESNFSIRQPLRSTPAAGAKSAVGMEAYSGVYAAIDLGLDRPIYAQFRAWERV
ncbi:hypothetical protein D9611_010603 [Ephemerocybe angulata]|uniref:Uncharacterized protein n=1 Tax=Ephemerocybe angulata TaxID=980116 RepID=A0A8H5BVS4_9AGAR|nr:hypothetical protein D9611_010603 [Tulosesus angulatus]